MCWRTLAPSSRSKLLLLMPKQKLMLMLMQTKSRR
jgi:hypothetical protein